MKKPCRYQVCSHGDAINGTRCAPNCSRGPRSRGAETASGGHGELTTSRVRCSESSNLSIRDYCSIIIWQISVRSRSESRTVITRVVHWKRLARTYESSQRRSIGVIRSQRSSASSIIRNCDRVSSGSRLPMVRYGWDSGSVGFQAAAIGIPCGFFMPHRYAKKKLIARFTLIPENVVSVFSAVHGTRD